MATRSFYDDPAVYDILHAPGTAMEVDGLERIERRFGPARPGAWLEPACGTGRYLRLAARRGRRVIGFDRSAAMIAYAQDRLRRLGAPVARRATLFVSDMEDFGSAGPFGAARRPRVTMAFNLINTFRHLEREADALAHLEAVRGVLAPGGIYALGLSLSAYGYEFASEDVWMGRRGAVQVRQIAQYEPPEGRGRFEGVCNVVVVTRGGREDEVIPSSYQLRRYSRGQLEALVGRAGLEIAGHTDERGSDAAIVEPGYGWWILRAG